MMDELPNGKLHDPGVAYGYAGFDSNFLMFKCYTKPLVTHKTGERGVFETEYRGVFSELDTSPDPRGWLLTAARRVVIHARQHPPTHLADWIIEFSPIVEKYNLPSHLFLSKEADRKLLEL